MAKTRKLFDGKLTARNVETMVFRIFYENQRELEKKKDNQRSSTNNASKSPETETETETETESESESESEFAEESDDEEKNILDSFENEDMGLNDFESHHDDPMLPLPFSDVATDSTEEEPEEEENPNPSRSRMLWDAIVAAQQRGVEESGGLLAHRSKRKLAEVKNVKSGPAPKAAKFY